MATPKKPAKIIQVSITHDGRLASVLYNDGHVFLHTYTKEPIGSYSGEGNFSERQYLDTKVATKT
jgi:prepilin-type processing-associated H-X9-DG protein